MHANGNPGYRGRVRSGCLTCRARKVKCDETRPVCANCTRLERTCTYKPRKGPRATAASPTSPRENPQPLISPPLSSVTSVAAEVTSNHPYVASVDATLRLSRALQRSGHGPLPPSPHDCCPVDSTPAALVSRDIELTTTMDFLAAEGKLLQLSSSTFVEDIECPGITPYDPANWSIMKHHVVKMGENCVAVALGINAVSAVHKAQVYGLSLARALSLYESTKTAFGELLVVSDHARSFDPTLVVAFLLCFFELLHAYVDTPVLKEPVSPFLDKLDVWGENTSTHSDLSQRLVAWLKIIFATTLRGGRNGLVSRQVYTLLPSYQQPLPSLQAPPSMNSGLDTTGHLFDVLSTPLFDLYFRLQILSGDIAHLTHYHRSRTTGEDQEEVVEHIKTMKAQLRDVWENRCATARQLPDQLRSQLTTPVANRVISLIGLCAAAYHTEIVEIDRVLGDPVSQFTDSRPSLDVIKDLVDGDWAAYNDAGKLNPGYLRPLFLYAIESMDEQKSQWAAQRLAEIKSPIHRSDFFSAFAKSLAGAQALKDRRVTSKYFCISYFGVPPPFM